MATRLVQIAMNARDDSALGRFWAQALGWCISSEEPGVTNLEPPGLAYPDPSAVYLDIIAVPEPKTVKNRVHVDLATTSAAHQAELVARPVRRWGLAHQARERRAEGAERGEPHGHAHLGHRQVTPSQQRHRAFHPPGLQVAVRRVAIGLAEPAGEQRRRHQRGARHRRDVKRPCVLAFEQVPGPAQVRQLSDLHTRTVHVGSTAWRRGLFRSR